MADRAKLKGALRAVTAKDVEAMLEFATVPLEGTEGDVVPYARRTLAALVQRVELDPDERTVQVRTTGSD